MFYIPGNLRDIIHKMRRKVLSEKKSEESADPKRKMLKEIFENCICSIFCTSKIFKDILFYIDTIAMRRIVIFSYLSCTFISRL